MPTPMATPMPTAAPAPTLAPPPPPPSGPTPVVRALPPCNVTLVSASLSGTCTRYITSAALYRDIYSCRSGSCYAQKFREMSQAPMVVVYPEAAVARAEARTQLHAELVAGIRAMGATAKAGIASGQTKLPSVSRVDSLVQSAISEVDNIDQPIDESPAQRQRRLGLGPSIRTLADSLRN